MSISDILYKREYRVTDRHKLIYTVVIHSRRGYERRLSFAYMSEAIAYAKGATRGGMVPVDIYDNSGNEPKLIEGWNEEHDSE